MVKLMVDKKVVVTGQVMVEMKGYLLVEKLVVQ
jgi:hypothetical protein